MPRQLPHTSPHGHGPEQERAGCARPSCAPSCAERGWCERLVDVAAPDSPLHLRMVLSPGATPAARALLPRRLRQLPAEQQGTVQALEVCPQVRQHWLLGWRGGSWKCKRSRAGATL